MKGRINLCATAALCLALPVASFAQTTPASPIAPAAVMPAAPAPAAPDTAEPAALILPEGTPVIVAIEKDISTTVNSVGDQFRVTVVHDVIASGVVVIPQGTTGMGEVTFVSRSRSFGNAGMLGIALRTLTLDGKDVVLDGRYREEGKGNEGAAAVTMFAVGIFAGLVKGKISVIPKGRELKARTGEDIPYSTIRASSAETALSASPSASSAFGTTNPKSQPATEPAPDATAQPAAAQTSTPKPN